MMQQQSKKTVLKFILSLIFLVGGVSGILIILGEDTDVKQHDIEEVDAMELEEIKEEEPFPIWMADVAAFEFFYRGEFILSQEQAKYAGLKSIIAQKALIYHLTNNGYIWDDFRTELNRSASEGLMQNEMNNPLLQDYFDELFEMLDITEEDYLNYLILGKEYDAKYASLFEKRIGLDEDGAFAETEVALNYLPYTGITEEQLDDLASKIPKDLQPMDPQPTLSFSQQVDYLTVTMDAEGDYIFTTGAYPYGLRLEERYWTIFNELERTVGMEIARVSIDAYIEAVANYSNDDPEKMKAVQEVDEYFKILKNTFDYYTFTWND